MKSVVLLLLLLLSAMAQAATPAVGQWYQAGEGWSYQGQSTLVQAGLTKVDGVALSGGHFLHQTVLEVSEAGRYVIDFSSSSVIGHFHHYLFDRDAKLVAELQGGLQSAQPNDFFLRHGREVELAAGEYLLISELDSPLYLAQPAPYLDTLAHYRAAIKPGNALTLLGIGIFLGLGVYYAALAVARQRMAEGMYALFILGNILFFSAALLVNAELLGVHWIYLAGMPILLSNMAYIAFVRALLQIRNDSHPALYRAGSVALGVLALFIPVALLFPNWSLELARYGVAIFLGYGLFCGVMRAVQGSILARYYLVAIIAFFMLGGLSISLGRMLGTTTFYVEHVGLLAVAVEVVLLALVLAYQFGQLHREREHALLKLEHSQRMARTDSLTGLPNRYALDYDLTRLSNDGSLTFIDMDNLKYYNDHFGHERGDELLCGFAHKLAELLGSRAAIYRVGGDEFAITCPSGDIAGVEQAVADSVDHLRSSGFEQAGASAGSARVKECARLSILKHTADLRMYDVKRHHKLTMQSS